ncbi:hypothetical protein [Roseomonas sp. KE0001]|uniref:hypothetical protein n=1 Tax=Roseomonas sp. KE0001 TaxID=2479201 RepID=UPI0018DF56D5|nr:hypothetical protein [Roseomonas sp. KE0001]
MIVTTVSLPLDFFFERGSIPNLHGKHVDRLQSQAVSGRVGDDHGRLAGQGMRHLFPSSRRYPGRQRYHLHSYGPASGSQGGYQAVELKVSLRFESSHPD